VSGDTIGPPDLLGRFFRGLLYDVIGAPAPGSREENFCECGRRRADCTENGDTAPLLRCGCCNWDDHAANMSETRAGYVCQECEENIEVT